MTRSSVVFPEPFSPISPVRSPAGTVSEASVSTRRGEKEGETPSTRTWAALSDREEAGGSTGVLGIERSPAGHGPRAQDETLIN